MVTTTVISRHNPYVGPRPYKEGEVIYGREREAAELLDILIAERIVLLYSPSGAGKSSLLNAAILPKMAGQGFEVYPVMRVNSEPPTSIKLGDDFNRYVYSCLESIEEGLPEKKRFSKKELVKLKFKDYLAKHRERARQEDPTRGDAPILLVFDQAEEVIRISMLDRDKKQDFFMQMGEILRDRNIWALVAMREDYLASFDPYLRPIPTRFSNRYRLTFLGVDAAMQAIQHPAQNAGVEFPDDSAQQLVDDLRTMMIQQPDGNTTQELGPTVEPVQLQVVCRRLWSNLPSDEKTITLEQVKALGDVNRALADYYSLQVASVAGGTGVPEREIREWFDRKLITASRIRGQVLMTPEKSEGLDNRAISMLELTYLIRAEKRGGATWFELSHDRLVRPIRENNSEWFEKHLNVLQRRADIWNQQSRPDSLLLIGPEFQVMQKWAEGNRSMMTQAEKDFYHDSMKAQQNLVRERWTNILIRWLFVASVIAALVAAGFYLKSHISEQNAVARELAAASVGTLQSDPERSVLLALAGWDVTSNPRKEILQALHLALPTVRIVEAAAPPDGRAGSVLSVDYSPDGKYVASANKNGLVYIWSAATLKSVATLTIVEHTENYNGYGAMSAAYSPDGKSLAAVGADGRLSVWDTATWKPKYQLTAGQGKINTVVYSPDGKYIATGGVDSVARVWDSASGKQVYNFPDGNKTGVETLSFSVDSTVLFSGGDDDLTIYAWQLANGQLAYKLSLPNPDNRTIYGLAVSPDGRLLASSGDDRLVRIWNLQTKDMMEIPGHVDWVWGVVFTPDSKTLISASSDRTIRLWDTQYGRSQMILTGPANQVFSISLSPNGRYLAGGSADNMVRIWDISPAGSYEVFTREHGSSIHDLRISPDGKLIASAGTNSVINLWDASTGALVKKLQSAPTSAEALSWGHDGKTMAAGYASGQTIVWNMKSYTPQLTISPEHPSAIWTAALSPDGTLLATGNNDGDVIIYNANTGEKVASLNADQQYGWLKSGKFSQSDLWVSSVAFSPDGKTLASSYGTGLIVIWDWHSGKPVFAPFDGHHDIVEKITYNADGSLLASGGDDGNAILWDLNPNIQDHLKTKFVGHSALVYDVAFSPDGRLLATGSGDRLVKIWDVKSGNYILDLYGATNRVHAVAFTPDGRHVVSGATDGTVRVFTLDPAELVRLANARLTRSLSAPECQEYLNMSCSDFEKPDPLRLLTDFLVNKFGW